VENESSEVHIGRMLQILREFSDDPVLSSYVIDDIWDDMKAMKVYLFLNFCNYFDKELL
jgi:cohesin complex subunit SA-1/2